MSSRRRRDQLLGSKRQRDNKNNTTTKRREEEEEEEEKERSKREKREKREKVERESAFFVFFGCFFFCLCRFLLFFLGLSEREKTLFTYNNDALLSFILSLYRVYPQHKRKKHDHRTHCCDTQQQLYSNIIKMGKINIETEVESVLSEQSATCEKLKIRVSETVEGVNLSAKFVLPVNVEVSSKGNLDANMQTSKVDLEAAKDFWKIKLDDVDQNTQNIMDVLKISVREKVSAIDSTATLEWKAKGNAVKGILEPPVFEGVKSTLEFDNSKKQLTVTAKKKIDKIDVSVKADANVKTQTFKGGKMTLSYPLPEGVKGSLEASTNGSGKITLRRGNLSAKMPLKNFTSAPNMNDVKLEFNYSTDIASF